MNTKSVKLLIMLIMLAGTVQTNAVDKKTSSNTKKNITISIPAADEKPTNLYTENKYFAVRISTKAFYNTNSNKNDLNYSHINFGVGSAPGYPYLETFLQDFTKSVAEHQKKINSKNPRTPSYLVTFSVQVSMLPAVANEYVENAAQEEADHEISEYRKEYLANLETQLAKNPSLQKLPEEQREATIKRMLTTTAELLDKKLALVRQKTYKHLNDRTEEMRLPLAVQEVAIGFAKHVYKDSVIYLRAGRGKVSVGPSLDEAGQSKLGNERPNETITNLAPSPTLFTTIGIQRNLGSEGDGYLRIETSVFDNKQPFISLDSYVHRMVALDNSAFDQQMDFFEIDSQLVRFFLKYKKVELYFAAMNYDGTFAFSAGAVCYITSKDELRFDYVQNNPILANGFQVFYLRKLTDTITGYTGLQIYRDLDLDGKSGSSGLEVEPVIGAKFNILSARLWRVFVNLELYSELAYKIKAANPDVNKFEGRLGSRVTGHF